jgi:hypothetical protein
MRRHEENMWSIWPYFKGFGVEIKKQAKIHYSRDFLVIFENFDGGKGTQAHKYGRIILVNI